MELLPEQRKVYDQMEQNMVAWLGEQEDSPLIAPIVVAQLTRLGQMALAMPNIDPETNKVNLTLPSTKFDVLKELVTMYDEKQFIVFTTTTAHPTVYFYDFFFQKNTIILIFS